MLPASKAVAPAPLISAMLGLMKFPTLLSIMFWGVVASCAVAAGAQRTTIVNLASLPKWHVEKSQAVSLNDVRQWEVQPQVDHEYGVTRAEIRTYAQGKQSIQTLVEKAPDPSSAFGLLTFYQNESMKPAKGTRLAMLGPKLALMARGVFFVRAMRPPKMSAEDFRSALIDIAGASPSSNDMALLPPSMPAKGIIEGSRKYILGPIAMQQAFPSIPANLVGFNQGAELQAAKYAHRGKPLTLIFISYPTYPIARARYAAMEKRLGINQKSGTGAIYGKIWDSYVLLTEDAQSKDVANRLMSRLTIRQVVTWDQPRPGKPVTVQMFHLILGNIILVIVLVGLALMAGFLMFVSRRLVARWFPHSDWARGYEDSIIRLNLK